MLILCDPNQLINVLQPEIKTLLEQRFQQISEPEPYDPETHGYFVLIQPGDTEVSIAVETDINMLGSLFDDSVYGDPDFAPCCECVIDHGTFFEVVYIFSDSGCAYIFIVNKAEEINTRILDFCNEFSEPCT